MIAWMNRRYNPSIEIGEMSRWRDLHHPISPLDQITPDSPKYEEGKIPAGYVVLLWDGHALRGPMRFPTQDEADSYLLAQPGVRQYMIIPKPPGE